MNTRFQASPRFAKNAPKSRLPLRGPPIPGLGNPDDCRSIPTVCNLGTPKGSCGTVRGSAVVGFVGGGRAVAGAEGDERVGESGAEGDERDRLVEDAADDDDEDLDADERDDLFLACRTGGGRGGGAAPVVAEG